MTPSPPLPSPPPLAQTFDSAWPGVLDEMAEYLLLSHLSLGQGRPGSARVLLAKALVPPAAVQPHAQQFLQTLARKVPSLACSLRFEDRPLHLIQVHYPQR